MENSALNSANQNQLISNFLRKTGLEKSVKPEVFWKKLVKRFGKSAENLGEAIAARENGLKVDVYTMKNQSLDFANAVASQFDSQKLRAVAAWYLSNLSLVSGATVLELGCDNGIFLCLLASIYPDTKFLGIDPCEEAIKLAKERADLHGLKNIEFKTHSITSFAKSNDASVFEIIFSITLFHEILDNGGIGKRETIMSESLKCFSIEEIDNNFSAKIIEVDELIAVSNLIHDDGIFISVDRWSAATETLKWVRLNEKAGLNFDHAASSLIKFEDMAGSSQILPLTVFSKIEKPRLQASEILSFLAYLDFREARTLSVIENMKIAEIIYGSLNREEIYFQEQIYHNDSGTMHIEIGLAGGLGYIYETATTGFRKLTLVPSIALDEKVNELLEKRRDIERYAELNIRWGRAGTLERLSVAPDKAEDL